MFDDEEEEEDEEEDDLDEVSTEDADDEFELLDDESSLGDVFLFFDSPCLLLL